jgi:4-hydroxy-tetrahydrodipicolinate synthase
MPRQPLSGDRRKAVEKIIKDALAARPKLPNF